MGSRIQKRINKTALQRIETLEQTLQQVVAAVNNALKNTEQNVNALISITNAVKRLNPEVDVEITRHENELHALRVIEVDKKMKAAIESGDLVATDTITDKSIIVGHERKADGTDADFPHAQVPYSLLSQENKDLSLGKSVGLILSGADGGTFEVLEIYDMVNKAAPTLTEGTSAEN